MENEEVFNAEERQALAVKAVNRLIADVEAKRLLDDKELAEAVAVCIRETALPQLRTLKWLLEQQELERPDLQQKSGSEWLFATEAMRRTRVRQLFEARPSEEHTETGVLLFYRWLQQHHPELLPSGPADPYQQLKVDLRGLYK